MRNYEPPAHPEPLNNQRLYELYPGVKGYAQSLDGEIHILMIWGQGVGSVGKMLDELSPRCRVVNVLNPRMKGMLERRGWVQAWRQIGEGEILDSWAPPVERRSA